MPFINDNEMIKHFNIMDHDTISISTIIQFLTQYYGEDDAYDTTRRYCLYTSKDTKQRVCLAFLYMNHYTSDLQKLVAKNKASCNELNQQWAEVFDILSHRRLDNRQTKFYHQRLDDIHTTDVALSCLIELTRLSLHFDQGNYHHMRAFDDVHYPRFDSIQDAYLVDFFTLTRYQRLFTFYWTRNQLILARKYAFRSLAYASSPFTQASLHMNLGLTYLFDTYEQAMYHLNRSLQIAKKCGYDAVSHTVEERWIPFLSAHFKQVKGVTSNDAGEQAHLEIAKGNHDKAVRLLYEEPLDTPYKLYYLGLAKQDENILQQAYTAFIRKQNMLFFARLPLQALNKLKN